MLQTELASAEATFDRLAELLMSPTLEEIREHLRCLRNIAEKGGTIPRLTVAPPGANVFRREAEYWVLTYRGRTSRLRESLGLRYIAHLLAHPGRSIPSLEIGAAGECDPLPRGGTDPVPLVDARAIRDYRAHLSSLDEELAAARSANDLGRCERLESEIHAIRREVDSVLGLGGRVRGFSSATERARLNVTRAIRKAMTRVASADPALGEHFARAIHTGTFCSYDPDPSALPQWHCEPPTVARSRIERSDR